jgi:hypothetical protein
MYNKRPVKVEVEPKIRFKYVDKNGLTIDVKEIQEK